PDEFLATCFADEPVTVRLAPASSMVGKIGSTGVGSTPVKRLVAQPPSEGATAKPRKESSWVVLKVPNTPVALSEVIGMVRPGTVMARLFRDRDTAPRFRLPLVFAAVRSPLGKVSGSEQAPLPEGSRAMLTKLLTIPLMRTATFT